MPFSSVFAAIREYTDTIQPHPGAFIDMDNVNWCSNLQLLTLDPHDNQCCKPVLAHCLKSYNPSGWFPDTRIDHPYLFIYVEGKWWKYEE